ncbi:MAG: hypothetical protein K1X67_12305 [Fimbriimonadaceae bacterium]|nr:hypothetical protein [Fimbriimonadaceae bacterium]
MREALALVNANTASLATKGPMELFGIEPPIEGTLGTAGPNTASITELLRPHSIPVFSPVLQAEVALVGEQLLREHIAKLGALLTRDNSRAVYVFSTAASGTSGPIARSSAEIHQRRRLWELDCQEAVFWLKSRRSLSPLPSVASVRSITPRRSQQVGSAVIALLKDFAAVSSKPAVAQLTGLISALHSLARNHGPDALEFVFSQVNPRAYHPAVVVTLLRATYVFRGNISSWRNIRDIASQYFAEKGHDPKKLLVGLGE